eukprot:3298098-Karenia_brevis.AAC.1
MDGMRDYLISMLRRMANNSYQYPAYATTGGRLTNKCSRRIRHNVCMKSIEIQDSIFITPSSM